MKKWLYAFSLLIVIGVLAACGDKEGSAEGSKNKDIKIGATSGPYSDMVTKAIKPGLEELGYKVKVVEFSDYIQPNIALDKGDLDANLFQHSIYLENFEKENDMDLSGLIIVPTAPMGIYSNTYGSLEEVEDGATITIPNDPVNAARAFTTLQDEGLLKIDSDADPLKVSEKDIQENPKKLKFEPLESGQLPRSVDSADLAAIPGNFALAAKMDLLNALALENMLDQYRNVIAVTAKNEDSQLAKDLISVVESDKFEKTIDKDFEGFGKPQWMKK